ncbi:MAG: hypothetical protein N4A72_00810 [Bacteroidales bacterium]|jgi:hypothetical protein|nr:hypothetical protein [Bacteroidales bacterium]
MNDVIKFFIEEKEWVFSGIGISVLGFIFNRGRKKYVKQKQKINNNSTGIQVGGDINNFFKKD